MTRGLVPLFVVLGICAASAADMQPKINNVDFVEAGIYEAKQVARVALPDAGNVPKLITDVQLTEKTTTIPAKLGLRFGFRYRLVGRQPGAIANLKLVVRIPERPKPEEVPVRRTVGDVHHFGFTFEPTELVPGTWTFEIWQLPADSTQDAGKAEKLAEQKFDVVRSR